jgi:hypothetical protein
MAGPTISPYGDVTSSALQGLNKYSDASAGFYDEYSLVEGQIEKIYARDDPDNDETFNKPGIVTLYDVFSRTPDGGTTVLRRCRALQPLFGGGINNFFEVLPTNPGPKAKKSINTALRPGTKVLVGFISGRRSSPVIVGALPHENELAINARPTTDEGVHLEGEFQGLNWKIENDGSLTVTFKGPKDDGGNALDSSLKETIVNINKTGDFKVVTSEGDEKENSVELNSTNKKITVKAGSKINMEMDSSSGKVKLECDDVEIDTVNDTIVNTEAKTKINAKQDVVVNSATGIKLQKGDAEPQEPFVLGKEFVTMMKELLQAISSHMHTGNLGAPTSPPANISDFKSLLSSPIGDKKILSKHILGVK